MRAVPSGASAAQRMNDIKAGAATPAVVLRRTCTDRGDNQVVNSPVKGEGDWGGGEGPPYLANGDVCKQQQRPASRTL